MHRRQIVKWCALAALPIAAPALALKMPDIGRRRPADFKTFR